MLKKIFIGASVTFATLLILWGVYTLFFSSPKKIPVQTNPITEPEEKQPLTPKARTIQPLIDAPVISPTLSYDQEGSLLYIDKNTGSLEKILLSSGKKEILTDVIFTSPISAVWQKNGTSVFVEELRSNSPSFQFLPLNPTGPSKSLKEGIRYLIWDELENNIVYTYQDTSGKITLNRALPDGSEWKELAQLPPTPVFIESIPKSPFVAFWEKPANARISELKTISLSGGEPKTLFVGKYGANYLWSPSGEKILISWAPEKNGSRLSLATINKNGGEYTDLNFPTLVEKCVWSGDNSTLYCALPGSLPQGSAMPDAFYDRSFTSNDTFWKIDTKTGKSERIVALEDMVSSYDAVNLLLSPDESSLFFVNRKDQKLYSIEL